MQIRGFQSNRDQLAQHATELLSNLGDDASAVGKAFGRIGVSGIPRVPKECAVASYLSAVIGSERAVQSVHVGKDKLDIRLDGWRPAVRVALPQAMWEFIAAFDADLFPELVQTTPANVVPPPHRSPTVPARGTGCEGLGA